MTAMDCLAEHNSELFSSDHVNIYIIISCTESTTIQRTQLYKIFTHLSWKELQNPERMQLLITISLIMILIIAHLFGLSILPLWTLQISQIRRCPAINLVESASQWKALTLTGTLELRKAYPLFTLLAKVHKLYWTSKKTASSWVISVQGLLTFQSYKHENNSIVIVSHSSVVILMGKVSFAH